MTTIFDPITVGDLQLPNRIIMAPLTRCRADEGRVPNALMAEYYVQRASAGLIISEATSVTPMGVGYPDTPGIWSNDQVRGWSNITKAVHGAGGRIVLQLWHVGRISHPQYLNGEAPVAPSAVQPEGHVSLVRPITSYPTPRALELAEIGDIVDAYRVGAENAKAAGFDGVEIHGANGYLLDQFLQTSTNQRTDQYGGSLENRARLLLEVTDAAIDVWGAGRVGVHLSPRADLHDMGDDNLAETFSYIAKELGKRGIASGRGDCAKAATSTPFGMCFTRPIGCCHSTKAISSSVSDGTTRPDALPSAMRRYHVRLRLRRSASSSAKPSS